MWAEAVCGGSEQIRKETDARENPGKTVFHKSSSVHDLEMPYQCQERANCSSF